MKTFETIIDFIIVLVLCFLTYVWFRVNIWCGCFMSAITLCFLILTILMVIVDKDYKLKISDKEIKNENIQN